MSPGGRRRRDRPGAKLSIYLTDDIHQEVMDAASRQDRSVSWVIQLAWRIAREKVASMPSFSEPT